MGLAKSLRQSCPYGSVHVSGATALGKLCQNIDLWSCVSHHYILALVPPSVFIHFSSSGKYLGAAGISRASRTFDLSGGCVPFGHWVTSLMVAFAVDNCQFLSFPYYF